MHFFKKNHTLAPFGAVSEKVSFVQQCSLFFFTYLLYSVAFFFTYSLYKHILKAQASLLASLLDHLHVLHECMPIMLLYLPCTCSLHTINLEIFFVKIFSLSLKATKINFAEIFVQRTIKMVKHFLQQMIKTAKKLRYDPRDNRFESALGTFLEYLYSAILCSGRTNCVNIRITWRRIN